MHQSPDDELAWSQTATINGASIAQSTCVPF